VFPVSISWTRGTLSYPCDDKFFQEGDVYLVFANEKKESKHLIPLIYTSLCGPATHIVLPTWKRNLMAAWFAIRMGRYDFFFADLFNTKNAYDELGHPLATFK
jgi:hypothetical protein